MPIYFGNALLIDVPIFVKHLNFLRQRSLTKLTSMSQTNTVIMFAVTFLLFWMTALNLWVTESHRTTIQLCPTNEVYNVLLCHCSSPVRARSSNGVMSETYPVSPFPLYTYIFSEIKIAEKAYMVLLCGTFFTLSQCRLILCFKDRKLQ